MLEILVGQLPWEYAPTVYRQDGSTIPHEDDVRDLERSYFEAFVSREAAIEVERRLKLLDEYEELEEWGAEKPEFEEMEDE